MPRPTARRSGFFALLLAAFCARAAAGSERTWAVIPIALANPENGLGLGLKFIDRAFLDERGDVDLQGYGTWMGQAEVKAEHRFRGWAGTRWRSRAEVEAFYYPESWFGGGNHPREEDEHLYIPLGWRAELEAAHPMGGAFLVKGAWRIQGVDMRGVERADGGEPDSALLGPQLAGYGGGRDDLLSLSLEFDTRDDERLPSRGWHAGLRGGHSALPADFAYGHAETWAAAYATPHPRWELAAKAFQATVFGDAPFYAYPHLGDKRLLRGIPGKRLRDRSAQALQAEARFGFRLALPLVARWLGQDWQVAAFTGAGRVGEDFASATVETVHLAGGLGGRLLIGRRLGALRGDLGFSRFGFGLYLDFNQAF